MTYLILFLVISIMINLVMVLFLKGASSKNKTLLVDLEKLNKKMNITNKIENEKTEIRERYGEKENDIDNKPGLNGVMPVEQKPRHNHKFGSPCGKGCPAYPGD